MLSMYGKKSCDIFFNEYSEYAKVVKIISSKEEKNIETFPSSTSIHNTRYAMLYLLHRAVT